MGRKPKEIHSTDIYGILRKPEFFTSGCTLLDCALGGGWVENRVINIIGDNCLSGDTVVSIKRGTKFKKLPIKEWFHRINGAHFNKNKNLETHILSDVNGIVKAIRLLSIRKTGEKPVYKIIDIFGNSIKASADHKFKTSTGWKTLKTGLKVGSSVKIYEGFVRGNKINKTGEKKGRPYTYSIPFHPFAQKNFVFNRNYKRLPTCKLIIEAKMNNLEFDEFIQILRTQPETASILKYIDPTLVVHHIDGNPMNNSHANLQVLSEEEHKKIHKNNLVDTYRITTWSKIKSIQFIGKECTYDISTEYPNNFIANGFLVHNSTGKSLLGIIACKNYHEKHPTRPIYYVEAEQAFNPQFAESLGFPTNNVSFVDNLLTVEDLFKFLFDRLEKDSGGGLTIIDSLDALSTEDEMSGEEIQGGYMGARKAAKMSELFRRLNAKLSKGGHTIVIISQTRENIGVVFGRKWRRAGGKALDFYASQRVVLSPRGKLTKTISGIKRIIGVMTTVLIDKNKVGLAYRSADIPILFDQGIDDERACQNWLSTIKHKVPESELKNIKQVTVDAWNQLEIKFRSAPVDEEESKSEDGEGT